MLTLVSDTASVMGVWWAHRRQPPHSTWCSQDPPGLDGPGRPGRSRSTLARRPRAPEEGGARSRSRARTRHRAYFPGALCPQVRGTPVWRVLRGLQGGTSRGAVRGAPTASPLGGLPGEGLGGVAAATKGPRLRGVLTPKAHPQVPSLPEVTPEGHPSCSLRCKAMGRYGGRFLCCGASSGCTSPWAPVLLCLQAGSGDTSSRKPSSTPWLMTGISLPWCSGLGSPVDGRLASHAYRDTGPEDHGGTHPGTWQQRQRLHGVATQCILVFNLPNLVNRRELLSCAGSPS